MKKPTGINSQIALINECKGNVFEFLVATELARKLKVEESFLKEISPQYLNLLRAYQNLLLSEERGLAFFLQGEARALACEILEKKPGPWTGVEVVGKLMASQMESFGEADILLGNEKKKLGLSLKISKKGSFTNTKSAGIRSFFQKYFPSCYGEKAQKKLNRVQNIEFKKLSRQLEEKKGLCPSDDFSSWKRAELSELPGSLTGELRRDLKSYYQRLLDEVFLSLEGIYQDSPSFFKSSLRSLMGFANPEILQVICYYSQKDGKYFSEKNSFIKAASLPMESISLEKGGGSTSLYIYGENWTFQLRVKPMNVFTTKAIKLNGSLSRPV